MQLLPKLSKVTNKSLENKKKLLPLRFSMVLLSQRYKRKY